MSMKGIAGKETIYVDIDDEITAIIDKVTSSKQEVVALVLPKRSAVLQSVVNMRLLKRGADDAGKKLVIVSSDSSVLPLAGLVGLHTAKNLQSKPEIPPGPASQASAKTETIADSEPELDKEASVGELAGDETADTETIELDDDEPAPTPAKTPKAKKDRKLKIPDFDRFRVGLILAFVGGLMLVGFLIYAVFIAPKAVVTITTDSTTVKATLVAKTSGTATTLDEKNNVMPSSLKELKQTDSEKVPATGQKDVGTKATGTMTLTNCIDDGESHTVPMGTAFSSGGLTFLTTVAVTLDPALYSGSTCKSADFGLSKNITVTASKAGAEYNLPAKSYSSSISGIIAQGSAMTGGTTKVVKVVSDADVETAKQKIATRNVNVQSDFHKRLEAEGLFVLQETATATEAKVTATPEVGSEANEVTINQEITYSVLTVKEADLSKLVENELNKQIDTSKQELATEDVLKGAIVRVTDKSSNTDVTVNVEQTALAIPILDQEEIKKAVAGKKVGDIQSTLSSRPGIKEVNAKLSPFWVSKAPKKTSKIVIVVDSSLAEEK